MANRYNAATLLPADAARQHHPRAPKAELEWRVSRALLQSVPAGAGTVTLSHKNGHAAVAAAPEGWKVGIDLEQVRDRDVERLAAWMADERELDALRRLPPAEALRHFYRLWTFKEAMIKARGQVFPEDLKRNALSFDQDSGNWRVEAPGGGEWSVRVFEALPNWVLSVVWQSPSPQLAELAWHVESDAPDGGFHLGVACGASTAPRP